jgi:hypothetical protein
MNDYIPLFQTLLWVMFYATLVFYFRSSLHDLKEAIKKRLMNGGSVRIGPVELGELRNEVKTVRDGLSELNQTVSKLFLSTMSPKMYFNLKKLASGSFGPFVKSKGLERELYHLRDIGYIDIESITKLPEEGTNLSTFVTITDMGVRFVQLRESLIGNVCDGRSE